jgi:prepilin-type processing-associated H-X9-DG protein
MSNMRQVYLGFQFYADEFHENFPWPWIWYDYLGDRLGKTKEFSSVGLPRHRALECPAEEKVWWPGFPRDVTMYEHDWIRCSYMMNFNIGGYAYTPTQPGTKGHTRKGFYGPTINVGGRSEAPIVIDCSVTTNIWGLDYPLFGWGLNTPSTVQANWDKYIAHMFRHPNLTANMLYLDGHVAPLRSTLHGGPPTYVVIFEGDEPP